VRKFAPLLVVMFAAACATEKAIAPAAQPQKSALLRCDQQREQCEKPLLFVDGKRMDWVGHPDFIPGDIESVEVIKGKAAIERYGQDGRNGVVFIVMKKARM
jgi:hypothetical protein